MNIEETIDAFIDDETVDAAALDAALGSTNGRAYLFDALALRGMMAAERALTVAPLPRGRTLAFYARAAVVALALVGLGYAAGSRNERAALGPAQATAQVSDAPEPTRVIELSNWQDVKGGD